MKPPHYDEVHQLVLDMVNSGQVDDTRTYWEAYSQLKAICEQNENSETNHPFQWESLADFTIDSKAATNFYEKALQLAERMKLNEYVSTIKFALAEKQFELKHYEQSFQLAKKAEVAARESTDIDHRKEISELLLRISEHT